MKKKFFVGGLSYNTREEGLRAAFEVHGTVNSAKIMTDRDTGRSRGFGFVEMDFEAEDGAQKVIQGLNGTQLDGRTIKVEESQERAPRTNDRTGGGGRGGFGGGRNRY